MDRVEIFSDIEVPPNFTSHALFLRKLLADIFHQIKPKEMKNGIQKISNVTQEGSKGNSQNDGKGRPQDSSSFTC